MSTRSAHEVEDGPDRPWHASLLCEQSEARRIGSAFGAGLAVHATLLAGVLVVIAQLPERVHEVVLPERLPTELVWLPDPGPGGGGGGGNQMEEPPKPVELPGDEEISLPVAAEEPIPVPQPDPVDPPPVPTLPVVALGSASSATIVIGGLTSSQVSDSLGLGDDRGVGPDDGAGAGPGRDRGSGGGPPRPGNGVLQPRLLRQVEPRYTAEAMLARIQGDVWLDCVVLPDGTIGDIAIVRSLDAAFGLDEEAVRAARQWRFEPGTRDGEPVAVLVTIELSFALH